MAKEKNFDSSNQREADKAKIRNENLERQKDIEAEDARLAENQEIANFKGLPQPGETRDQLLDRIRAMREEKPKEVEVETFRSAGQQKEFTAEQEAGRAAVAKAQEDLERNRALWQAQEAGEKNKAG